MNKLIGNFIIFVGCAFLQFYLYPVDISYIAILLVAFIICFFHICFSRNPDRPSRLQNIFLIGYLVAGCFLPHLSLFAPSLLWRPVVRKTIPGILLFVGNICNLYLSHSPFIVLIAAWISVLGLYCEQVGYRSEKLEQNITTLRDNAQEHTLLMEKKNKMLMESQDTNIYNATLKERNRIAREIHDNVGHLLTRSILQIGAIKTINKDEILAEPLNNLHETLDYAMTSIRESVHDLHDESIDLKQAINEIIKPIEEIHITMDYDLGNNVPRKIKYCFISIIKEAVNNTTKHSNAKNITIVLREHPGFYQLHIADDGTNISTNFPNGIGLTNMQDRVYALSGNFKISTEQGFQILVSIFKENI